MTWQPVGVAATRSATSAEPAGAVERTHVQVLTQIEERILDGRLRPGDRLPAERDLADLLRVSRGSVREALRVLRAMGIVASGAGRGPDSGCIVTGEPTPALSNLLQLHLALAHFDLDDLVETRIQLEAHAAAQAAARAGADQLDHLTTLLEKMADPALPAKEFNALDTEFHVAIGEASGNRLVSLLMQGLRDSVKREMVLASESFGEWAPVARRLHAEHGEILEHIRSGDGPRAARLLDSHIRRFYTDVVTPSTALHLEQ